MAVVPANKGEVAVSHAAQAMAVEVVVLAAIGAVTVTVEFAATPSLTVIVIAVVRHVAVTTNE